MIDNPAHAERTLQRLHQVCQDPAALARLGTVARHQLHRSGLHQLDADDLIGDAVLGILRGAGSGRHGRHPQPEQVADAAAFERWFNGILESLATNKRRSADREAVRNQGISEPVPTEPVVACVDARLREAHLLAGLRQAFAEQPQLLALLKEWEFTGWGSFPGRPHEAHALRCTAREILRQDEAPAL